MIAQLNKLIKAETKKLLVYVLALNIYVFIALALYIFVRRIAAPTDAAVIIWIPNILGLLPFLPFITVCGLVTCFIKRVKPNARKSVERFCNKTDYPEDTFNQLEQTWEHGAVFVQNHTSSKGMLIDKLPIRIDKNYLIGIIGFWLNVKIIPFENAVWMHAGKPDEWTGVSDALYIYSVKDNVYRRKKYKIRPIADIDLVESILDHIVDNCPDIAVGKYKEAKTFWKNGDIEGLRNFAKGNRSRILEKREAEWQAGLREKKAARKSIWYAVAQLCTMIPTLVAILLAMYLGARSLDSSLTALEVLQGYERWAVVMFNVSVAALLFVVAANLFISVKLIKSKAFKWYNLVVVAIAIGTMFFIHSATISYLDRNAIREDIYAIESDNLTTGLYWIDLNSLRDELGGITSADMWERVVYRQNMSGTPRPDGRWWLSGLLYFTQQHSPDYLRAIAGSDEYQVREQAPDRRYFIVTYTPNFRLVVDVMATTDVDR